MIVEEANAVAADEFTCRYERGKLHLNMTEIESLHIVITATEVGKVNRRLRGWGSRRVGQAC